MNYIEKAQMWKEFSGLDPVLRSELEAMTEEELKEAFTNDITFGTGGLRGILGAGTAYMNYYTVRKATYGFGK
jgi:phosphoglucomutase